MDTFSVGFMAGVVVSLAIVVLSSRMPPTQLKRVIEAVIKALTRRK
jgi:hypothetical protein